MSDWVTESEAVVRLVLFAGVFLTMALWELAAPCRALSISKPRRWRRNLAIVVLNTLLARILLPIGAVGLAFYAENHGWGLLHAAVVPRWLAVVTSVILFDLLIYLQHVMFHAVPALWRLHVVHHADLDFDVTTGTRFHPLEIVLSMVIKMSAVAALGPPPEAVLIFEVLLNATAMFNHGNVHLPGRLDETLRWLVVTPDMHRVHHSIVATECHSNFGFNLPWWDRLLGTYRGQPAAGHQGMSIGIDHLREPTEQTLWWMLALPFRTPAGASLGGRRPRHGGG